MATMKRARFLTFGRLKLNTKAILAGVTKVRLGEFDSGLHKGIRDKAFIGLGGALGLTRNDEIIGKV